MQIENSLRKCPVSLYYAQKASLVPGRRICYNIQIYIRERNMEEITERNQKRLSKKLQKKEKKPWVLRRHAVITEIARVVLTPYTKLRYHISIDQFKEQGNRQYLILYNHQTAFDQFFMGIAFKGPLYYLASEDLFSNGFISRLLRFAVAPIPIRKQTVDIGALKSIFQVIKEGGSLSIAPEGNRTYSGRTAYIKPSIASLARKLKLPVALFRIEGGYGIQPRWSDVVRDGHMKAGVRRVIEPEEMKAMTDEELYDIIVKELSVNEDQLPGLFPHKRSAEYLERAMYVCPDCGLSEFVSKGRVIRCTKCSWEIEYLPSKELKGLTKPFPFRSVADWYAYQNDFVNRLDPTADLTTPIYTDRANVFRVILYKTKKLLYPNAEIRLFGDRIEITPEAEGTLICPFSEISSLTILGKNKINIYHGQNIYQLKGDKHFNALKYLNLHTRSENIMKGHPEETFLGI